MKEQSLKKVPTLRDYPLIPDLISPIEFVKAPGTLLKKAKELNPEIFSFRMGYVPWIYLSGVDGINFFAQLKGDSVSAAAFRDKFIPLQLPGINGSTERYDLSRAIVNIIKDSAKLLSEERYTTIIISEIESYVTEHLKKEGIIEDLTVLLAHMYYRILGNGFLGKALLNSQPKEIEDAYVAVAGQFDLLASLFSFIPAARSKVYSEKIKIRDHLLSTIAEKKNKAPAEPENVFDKLIQLQHEHPELDLSDKDIAFNLYAAYWPTMSYCTAYTCWLMIKIASNSNLLSLLLKEQAQFQALDYDSIKNMKLLQGSIREWMRMHSMISVPRKVLKDLNFKGFHIPKNATIAISPYLENRNPIIYHNPDKYDPTRWDKPPDSDIYTSFMPGGVGTFSCVGLSLAIQLLTMTLAFFLRNFKFELTEKPPAEKMTFIVLPPSSAVSLRYEKIG